MIGSLFRSSKQSRPARPSFRPVLESLESREVLSSSQVSAAFHALPGDVTNLRTSLINQDNATIKSNLQTVASDVFLLRTGAPGFVTSDRLRIDDELFINGIRLVFAGFSALTVNNQTTSVQTIGLGEDAIRGALVDLTIAGFFPNSSGTAVLT
jgi:hypothetical protein